MAGGRTADHDKVQAFFRFPGWAPLPSL